MIPMATRIQRDMPVRQSRKLSNGMDGMGSTMTHTVFLSITTQGGKTNQTLKKIKSDR